MTAANVDVAAQNGQGHTLKNMPGYIENAFSGKSAQMVQVTEYLSEKGFIPTALAQNEVSWFYGNLGIDDMYFASESVESIANHIMALYGAKIFAYTKNDNGLDINLERETEEGAVYIHTSRPGVSQLYGPQHEKRIDSKYLDVSNVERAFRLESYRSKGTVSSSSSTQLRTYFVRQCSFVNPTPTKEQETDIRETADKSFLEKATENTLEIYSTVMKQALGRTGPVIEMFEVEGSRERRLYVEQFSNGITIVSLYLNQIPKSTAPPIEHSIHQIIKEASLIYCLPTTPLQSFFQTNKLSVQESIYGYIGWIFAQHFLNRLGNEYVSLVNILDTTNSTHQDVLTKMKKRLRTDTFTRDYILEIIKTYPELVKLLYINFAMIHYVNPAVNSLQPTLSYQRLRTDTVLTEEELYEKIRRTTSNSHELMVFESFLIFNKHVLKTNFYQPTKVALSFRMDPSFLPEIEYPTKLFGMFLVIGSEFRGFHLRFRDVARGGIRIIRSRNREAYSINLRSLFDENYALANTQQRKNKDIPEGGSKGTILLDVNQQDKALVAFEKYVDAVLDLLILGETPGIKERIVDLYKKPEILFFGPDEGTADYMDWASAHARERGASFWKAFTTGKSQSLGGIPHDTYGMTTRSVHQYVLGIYRKLGLKEENCHKLQTGGPDGDLGSNEIKISTDKTCGVVDGSGVLYDPEGIDRTELGRLAGSRLMISNFDVSKLSPKGFRVLVDEVNVKLPSGEVIDDGLSFRNNFHLNPMVNCEVFVPCGGRPESVDLQNVSRLLDAENHPRFKYIVEGANLFFTQEARLRLERAGAIVFKDASANKGGVTSSSLEVLAALAFTDEEFAEHMQVTPDHTPVFYQEYVKEVQTIIERNAHLEFEALWREHQRTRTPRSILSDDLSLAIVKLNENLQHTSLWDNVALRKVVLEEAFPNMLLKQVGLDKLMERVPENYVRAIFGSYLASRFVYKYGTEPNQFAFFEFMTPYFSKVQQ
ncbi:NAD-dependent glutamate dehydrogenase [Entomortierella chlamydospora]|uniref:NAD-specific glutamate dehydrogenase n=1 Tax=Entomortierella chlamydospora TaxID=101097 RepID=A0A9P6SYR6_9FUNG|nr:NAD-dependent glutamate dehydrogenase [Entomortierella chlamydospora]